MQLVFSNSFFSKKWGHDKHTLSNPWPNSFFSLLSLLQEFRFTCPDMDSVSSWHKWHANSFLRVGVLFERLKKSPSLGLFRHQFLGKITLCFLHQSSILELQTSAGNTAFAPIAHTYGRFKEQFSVMLEKNQLQSYSGFKFDFSPQQQSLKHAFLPWGEHYIYS